MDGTPPDPPAGFRASWEALGAPRRILLAVSGGSDSTGLMHLSAPLARGGVAVAVATVDHGLRASSAADAEMVAAWARDLGLPHKTLNWAGAKPVTGVQAAARAARYYLLAEHAIRIGAEAILTAHTADDQAETVLMRMARGSGVRGLAGMAATSLIAAEANAPVILLRPLLCWRRESLRRYLHQRGIGFLDDPSNDDAAFERVRVRRWLAASAEEVSVLALNETARSCRRTMIRLEQLEKARFDSLQGAFDALGSASLVAAGLQLSDATLVTRLIWAVGGDDHFPQEEAVEAALRRALKGENATIGGVVLKAERGRLRILREATALMGRSGSPPLAPVLVRPGDRVLWDRRFIVTNQLGRNAEVRPLGRDAAAYAADDEETDALAAAPALWSEGEIVAAAGDDDVFRPLADERFRQRVNRFVRIT